VRTIPQATRVALALGVYPLCVRSPALLQVWCGNTLFFHQPASVSPVPCAPSAEGLPPYGWSPSRAFRVISAPLSFFHKPAPLYKCVVSEKKPFPKKNFPKNFPKKFSQKNKRGVAVQEKYIIKKKMSYRTRTYTEKRNQRANAIIAY